MMRVRLKADGRIVEILADGSERALPSQFDGAVALAAPNTFAGSGNGAGRPPVRNWEQGKRSPRGPARALLKVIDKAPDVAFAVLRNTEI